MSKSTTIVTTTTALSNIADAIRADAEQSGRIPSKQRMLNTAAKEIAGPKHDWGYMTGATGPVVQKGIPAQRLAELTTLGSPSDDRRSASDRTHWTPRTGAEEIAVRAHIVELYTPEMAAYLRTLLNGDTLAIGEDFSTDTESHVAVQCMFEPFIVRADEEKGISPQILWGATPQLAASAGPAYFAAHSSEVVNQLVDRHIENWPEDAMTLSFKAFYMPHIVIVSPDYPREGLDEIDHEERAEILDEDEHEEDLLDAVFQVFVDERLDEDGRQRAFAQAGEFLDRLFTFLGKGNRDYSFTVSARP